MASAQKTAAPNSRSCVARRVLMLLMAAGLSLSSVGCTDRAASSPADQLRVEQMAVHQQLAGVWRLQSYVPEASLNAALLWSLSGETILVRFDHGRVKSANSLMTFDRTYRLGDTYQQRFKIFLSDDEGLEYESWGEFKAPGHIEFQTITPPWIGHGVLVRDGAPPLPVPAG